MNHDSTVIVGIGFKAAIVGAVTWGAIPGVAAAEWSTQTLGGMNVQIYTPASTSPTGDGRALMVVLHGCTQTAAQLRQYGNFEGAADMFGVVVALPDVPNGGVVAGCWDYYGPLHSRATKHTGPLVTMTEALRDDAALGIDADQMYILGLSSGGGQALVTGCLAPDLYAGVGAIAAPGLGTGLTDAGSVATTGAQAASLCQQLAGANAADLQSQLGIVLNDSMDFTVAQGYNAVNVETFAAVMSDGLDAMTNVATDMSQLVGADPAGTLTIYADGEGDRIANLQTMGLGHNWPAGSGAMGGVMPLTFVASQGVNLAWFAAEFFATHNVRTGGWVNPGGSGGGDSTGGDDGDGSGGGGEGSGGGGRGASASAGSAGDASGGGDATGSAASGGGALDDGRIEPTGCQCHAGRSGSPWRALGLAVLFVLASARRRGATCRA